MTRKIIRSAAFAGISTAVANWISGTWLGHRFARLSATHVRGGAAWHSSPGAYGLLAGFHHD